MNALGGCIITVRAPAKPVALRCPLSLRGLILIASAALSGMGWVAVFAWIGGI